MPSGVLAFTLTALASIPRSSATCSRIFTACGPIFGAARISVESTIHDASIPPLDLLHRFLDEARAESAPFQLGSLGGKSANIASGNGAEQRIGERVQKNVAVGVAGEALVVRQRDRQS